ncbi:MAG: FixH family protein [Algoriphagus sp.]|uniref:FixH family protein n=1 Tax=Algoriphagus sp. TaxID=1872435 RepID=UPI00262D2330|nr:FixH family protein [Algoriphagus sp.]MDG1276788.1 FixH family protein [Algoriphagus sp.]
MDWGKGILLSIIGFVVLIMTMVVISVRMDGIELVTENYYEAEINYQDRIDEESSALRLDRTVITYNSLDKNLLLDLPNGTNGKIQLFRPSDSNLDREFLVNVIDSNRTSVSLLELQPGYWKVQLSWTEGGKNFYEEKKITI